MKQIKQEFQKMYGKTLDAMVKVCVFFFFLKLNVFEFQFAIGFGLHHY